MSDREPDGAAAVTVEAVLFDLDGTLLDHEAAAAEAVARSLPDADPAFVVPRWYELTEDAIDRYLAGELSFTEQRRLRIVTLARELGLGSWDDPRADEWLAGYVRRYEAAWRAYPDVGPAVDALAARGIRLGVITNGDAVQQRAKIDGLRLAARLGYVLTSGEAGVAKPAPEIFHAACAGLGLPPAAVAYVGDRLVVDAEGAAAAGLEGIWLDRSGAPAPAGLIVPRITTLESLPGLVTESPDGPPVP